MLEEKTFLSFSYFTSPLVYIPEYRFSVTKTLMILIHELNTPNLPYSSVDIIRVKIGVVITIIPFCKKEQTRNQMDALICMGTCLYFFTKLSKVYLLYFIYLHLTLSNKVILIIASFQHWCFDLYNLAFLLIFSL